MGIDEYIFQNMYLILGVICLCIVLPYAGSFVLETPSDKVLFFGFIGLLLLLFQDVVDSESRMQRLENIIGRMKR